MGLVAWSARTEALASAQPATAEPVEVLIAAILLWGSLAAVVNSPPAKRVDPERASVLTVPSAPGFHESAWPVVRLIRASRLRLSLPTCEKEPPA